MSASIKDLPVRIKRVQRVRRRLSDGTSNTHFYHRPTKTKLPAPHDSAFDTAYEAAEQRLAQTTKEISVAPEQPALGLANEPMAKALDTGVVANSSEAIAGPAYLTAEEVCRRWRDQIMPETLANWRSLQIGPPYHKFGKAVLYRADLLDQWEQKYLVACDLPKLCAVNDRNRKP